MTWLDALGQSHVFSSTPTRIVSLVPSETQSVLDLGCGRQLVGVTDYCPSGHMAKTLGGTKNPNVTALLAQKPDLVLCNQEENTEHVVRHLIREGLRVHVSFPKSLQEGIEYAQRLASLLGVRHTAAEQTVAISRNRMRVFVPIWRAPWMTFNEHTYAHSVLHAAGFENVFAQRTRRKTLAQDLSAHPVLENTEPDSDTRYPRLSLDEIVRAKPDAILLPDEPYIFGEQDAAELRASTGAKVILLSGKPLFWYGTNSLVAIEELLRATQALW